MSGADDQLNKTIDDSSLPKRSISTIPSHIGSKNKSSVMKDGHKSFIRMDGLIKAGRNISGFDS